MANKVYAIGEALIDFIPGEKGVALQAVETFYKRAGGAPANVASVVAKLGGASYFVGQVGQDAFGDFLEEELRHVGVDTTYVFRTTEAKTALAFVSLKEDGDRDFSFYRHPSADMLLTAQQVETIPVEKGDILHFCSVDLVDFPVKKAHIALIEAFKRAKGVVSFDVNLRLNLWESAQECVQTVKEFIPYADILKFSEEEVVFVSGKETLEEGIDWLLAQSDALVIVTKGGDGADIYWHDQLVNVPGHRVDVVDTTGAGDAFIGSFLYSLSQLEGSVEQLSIREIQLMIAYSNAVAALVTTKSGAIDSIPTHEAVHALLNK